jgi:hypothetical protein
VLGPTPTEAAWFSNSFDARDRVDDPVDPDLPLFDLYKDYRTSTSILTEARNEFNQRLCGDCINDPLVPISSGSSVGSSSSSGGGGNQDSKSRTNSKGSTNAAAAAATGVATSPLAGGENSDLGEHQDVGILALRRSEVVYKKCMHMSRCWQCAVKESGNSSNAVRAAVAKRRGDERDQKILASKGLCVYVYILSFFFFLSFSYFLVRLFFFLVVYMCMYKQMHVSVCIYYRCNVW